MKGNPRQVYPGADCPTIDATPALESTVAAESRAARALGKIHRAPPGTIKRVRTLKRFISEDPMGLAAGLNTYAYADDMPENLVDPTGKNSVNSKNAQSSHSWNRPPSPGGEYPGPTRPMPGGFGNNGGSSSAWDYNGGSWPQIGCARVMCFPQCTADGPNAPYVMQSVMTPGSMIPLDAIPPMCECVEHTTPLQTTEPPITPDDTIKYLENVIKEGNAIDVVE